MDTETFSGRTREHIAHLMSRELRDLKKVQTTAWIQFKVEVEDENGNIIRVDKVDKALNSQMTETFQGSNLNKIIEEMFVHINTQIENPALLNSGFVFNQVLFLDTSFHHLNLT